MKLSLNNSAIQNTVKNIVFPVSTEVDLYVLAVILVTMVSSTLFDSIKQTHISIIDGIVYMLPNLLNPRLLIMTVILAWALFVVVEHAFNNKPFTSGERSGLSYLFYLGITILTIFSFLESFKPGLVHEQSNWYSKAVSYFLLGRSLLALMILRMKSKGAAIYKTQLTDYQMRISEAIILTLVTPLVYLILSLTNSPIQSIITSYFMVMLGYSFLNPAISFTIALFRAYDPQKRP